MGDRLEITKDCVKPPTRFFPFLATIIACIFSALGLADPLFTVTDLGTFATDAINNSGQIAGSSIVNARIQTVARSPPFITAA
jgi:hypothetical protein